MLAQKQHCHGWGTDNYCIYQPKHSEYYETIELHFGSGGADGRRHCCGTGSDTRRAYQAAHPARQTTTKAEKEGPAKKAGQVL